MTTITKDKQKTATNDGNRLQDQFKISFNKN